MSFLGSLDTDCEFCARDGKAIWGQPWEENLPQGEAPHGDWVIAAGCLKELHTRVWVVCSRHLAVFKTMYQLLPCPDCTPSPGHEISHLSEIRWDKHERRTS